ncbi:Tolloid-like protein 1, partial [Elysia marginata]
MQKKTKNNCLWYISSANYPLNYPNNDQCTWSIRAPSGTQVVLSFSAFDLQSSINCNDDYLSVYDGTTQFSTRLAKYCGEGIPRTVTSRENSMFIFFRSDDRITSTGFRARWTTRSVCGSSPSGTSGTVRSPNYPSNYPNNARCQWVIRTSPGTRVRLSFTYFRLESCPSDYLIVRDGSSSSSSLIGRLCGSYTPRPIVASGNVMYLQFYTDGSVTYRGFSASYYGVPVCGSSPSGTSGTVRSPNYPSNYPNNARCQWVIRTSPGTRVRLSFTYFRLESCPHDHLLVRDGSSSSSSLIGRLCGSYTPRPIVASGSAMYLEFYTDGSVTYRGFSASYYGVLDGPPTTPVWNPPTSPAWNPWTPPLWNTPTTPAGSIPSFSQVIVVKVVAAAAVVVVVVKVLVEVEVVAASVVVLVVVIVVIV